MVETLFDDMKKGLSTPEEHFLDVGRTFRESNYTSPKTKESLSKRAHSSPISEPDVILNTLLDPKVKEPSLPSGISPVVRRNAIMKKGAAASPECSSPGSFRNIERSVSQEYGKNKRPTRRISDVLCEIKPDTFLNDLMEMLDSYCKDLKKSVPILTTDPVRKFWSQNILTMDKRSFEQDLDQLIPSKSLYDSFFERYPDVLTHTVLKIDSSDGDIAEVSVLTGDIEDITSSKIPTKGFLILCDNVWSLFCFRRDQMFYISSKISDETVTIARGISSFEGNVTNIIIKDHPNKGICLLQCLYQCLNIFYPLKYMSEFPKSATSLCYTLIENS